MTEAPPLYLTVDLGPKTPLNVLRAAFLSIPRQLPFPEGESFPIRSMMAAEIDIARNRYWNQPRDHKGYLVKTDAAPKPRTAHAKSPAPISVGITASECNEWLATLPPYPQD